MKRSRRNRFYQAHVYACALTTIVCVLVIVIILLQALSLAHSKSAGADTANAMDKDRSVSAISVLQKKDNSPDAISRCAQGNTLYIPVDAADGTDIVKQN